MAASSTDKFSKTSSGDVASVATVTSPRSTGVTALSVDTQLNWPTDTGIKFSTFKLDSNNNKIQGSQTDWRGVSNGSNAISNIFRTAGAADTGNVVGDKVVMIVTAAWGEDIVEGLLSSHDQTGALLPAAVQTAIGTGTITNTNIAAGIQTSKLANPYKFSVYLTTPQAIGNGATVKVAYETKVFDTGTNVDIVTNKGRFTAPAAGFYQFNAAVNFGAVNGNTGGAIYLYKNGAVALEGTATEVGNATFTPSFIVTGFLQLAANDYVEVYYLNLDTVTRNANAGQAFTYFHGYLVSTT